MFGCCVSARCGLRACFAFGSFLLLAAVACLGPFSVGPVLLFCPLRGAWVVCFLCARVACLCVLLLAAWRGVVSGLGATVLTDMGLHEFEALVGISGHCSRKMLPFEGGVV